MKTLTSFFKQLALASSIALSAVSLNAQAAVIDFTSSAFSAVNGLTTYLDPISGVKLKATTTLGNSPTLTFNGGDGIGISSIGVPQLGSEIDSFENLNVLFNGPVRITNIEFLNLFGRISGRLLSTPAESIEVRVNGAGGWTSFTGTDTNSSGLGYLSSGFSALNVTSLDFRGTNGSFTSVLNDASLAKISYVPVPASAALLAIGAIGFVALRRRKQI